MSEEAKWTRRVAFLVVFMTLLMIGSYASNFEKKTSMEQRLEKIEKVESAIADTQEELIRAIESLDKSVALKSEQKRKIVELQSNVRKLTYAH